MGIFKQLLTDLQNKNPKTLELLNDISDFIDESNAKEFDAELIQDKDFTVKEELIHGYSVLYQYRKKAIMQKTPQGGNKQSDLMELRIISIYEPLSQKIIDDSKIRDFIIATLRKNLH